MSSKRFQHRRQDGRPRGSRRPIRCACQFPTGQFDPPDPHQGIHRGDLGKGKERPGGWGGHLDHRTAKVWRCGAQGVGGPDGNGGVCVNKVIMTPLREREREREKPTICTRNFFTLTTSYVRSLHFCPPATSPFRGSPATGPTGNRPHTSVFSSCPIIR